MPKGVYQRKSAESKFWEKVNKNSPVNSICGTPCWVWEGGYFSNGYGVIHSNSKNIRVHKYAYQLLVGDIPDGMCVCHHCDNRRCVRPDHLFLGTHNDNRQDCVAKGRQTKGEEVNTAKLTEGIIQDLKNRYVKGSHKHGARAIARDLGVRRDTISSVINGVTWKHLNY